MRRPGREIPGIALGVLLATAAAAQETPAGALPSVELPPPLARVLNDYEAAWGARDPAALAALFTEDGFVLSRSAPPVRGRDAIAAHYRGHGGPLALRALAWAAEGPVGWIVGAYASRPGDDDVGKFTLTLRRDANGHWLIASDMDNGNARPPSPEDDRAELARLEEAWNAAHLQGDAEALDRLWAEDLVVVVPGMSPLAKDDALGVWRTGRMRFARYDTSDVRVVLLGEAAVATGRLRRERVLEGGPAPDDWRFTKVYVRRAGSWRVLVYQASTAEP